MSEFPVDPYLKVIMGHTIIKSRNWWSAIILSETEGGYKVLSLYKWNRIGNKWRRKHKFNITSKKMWTTIMEVVNDLIDNI